MPGQPKSAQIHDKIDHKMALYFDIHLRPYTFDIVSKLGIDQERSFSSVQSKSATIWYLNIYECNTFDKRVQFFLCWHIYECNIRHVTCFILLLMDIEGVAVIYVSGKCCTLICLNSGKCCSHFSNTWKILHSYCGPH